jgi:regulator of protease activity HflC (stomatin/prohibitin superfamily)
VLLSPLNNQMELFSVIAPHINRGALHIINVKDSQFGLAKIAGQPKILFPGTHVVNDPLFQFDGFIDQLTPVLQHGSLHRIIVAEGTRALAWIGDDPKMFTAGIYYFHSPLFNYVGSAKINTRNVRLGPFHIVTVDDGRVGIAYDNGVLNILPPGEHWLNAKNNQTFRAFLPTTEQVRQLRTLEVLTNDGLVVQVIGSITFHIADPHKAVLNIGADKKKKDDNITGAIFETIMHRSNDTLASILTGTSVLTSAGMGFADSTLHVSHRDVPKYDGGRSIQPDELKHEAKHESPDDIEINAQIRHRFKEKLTHTLNDQWGVELSDMNVIDIKVMDTAVRCALAEGVRSNIVAVTDRKTAESKAETARILAQGRRDAAKIKTDAKTYAVAQVAEAQLNAGKMLEQVQVAVDIRMAETAANALAESRGSLIMAPDASFGTIMSLIGMKQRTANADGSPVKLPAPILSRISTTGGHG